MNPGPHRRHSAEFKLQVVSAALEGKGSIKSLARRFGVSHSLVLFWLGKHRQGTLAEEDSLLERLRNYERRVAMLERKIGQLTMEIDRLSSDETDSTELSASDVSADSTEPPVPEKQSDFSS
jgi:transposase